jgi:hypothetical protein
LPESGDQLPNPPLRAAAKRQYGRIAGAKVTFDSPDALNRFINEVRAELETLGFQRAARRLTAVQETTYTTGSEWLGELGAAIKVIRKDDDLPANLVAKLETIRAQVRRVWPAL